MDKIVQFIEASVETAKRLKKYLAMAFLMPVVMDTLGNVMGMWGQTDLTTSLAKGAVAAGIVMLVDAGRKSKSFATPNP